MTRYLFALPAKDRPIGGKNVLLWMVDRLAHAGHETYPLYPIRRHRYDFASGHLVGFHDPALLDALVPARREKAQARLLDVVKPALHARLALAPDDVIVVPEFRYPEIAAVYPENRRILVVQDVFGFARALSRDLAAGGDALSEFDAVLTTSEASTAAVASFAGMAAERLYLAVPPHRFGETKKKIVAYMPRKRAAETRMVTAILAGMPEFADWRFVPIERMPQADLARLYEEALVFLSFSQEEGFGLPPAEAMTAGCVVIGYTGVGAEEYFDATTGFPVPDGDIVAFVETARRVAKEHATDPGAFDALRRRASDRIRGTYSAERAEKTLAAVWADLDRRLAGPGKG